MVGLGACGKIPTHCKPLRVGFGFPFRDWAGKSGEFSIASLVVALTLRYSSREIWNRIYFELYFFSTRKLENIFQFHRIENTCNAMVTHQKRYGDNRVVNMKY